VKLLVSCLPGAIALYTELLPICPSAITMASKELRTSINNISLENPAMQEGLKKQIEKKVSPSEMLPVLVADMVSVISSAVNLDADLYVAQVLGFASVCLLKFKACVRGNETSSLNLNIEVAAGVGTGKTESSKCVKGAWERVRHVFGLDNGQVVYPRGTRQGLEASLATACRDHGAAIMCVCLPLACFYCGFHHI
jgi:hypothetical protein